MNITQLCRLPSALSAINRYTISQHILRHIFDRYSKMSATLFLINRQIYVFFIFDYLSNSSKPSDCCRKISVHKMASVNELKNELSSVVNSTFLT